MKRYDRIQPLAFGLRAGSPLHSTQFSVLSFPAAWTQALLEPTRRLFNRNGKEARIPVWSLNALLRALVPNVICTTKDAGLARKTDPWLYAHESIRCEAVHAIVDAWVRTRFGALPAQELLALRSALRPEEVRWSERTVDLIRDTGELAYTVLPDVLAAKLSASLSSIHVDGAPLAFRRVPRGPMEKGTEIVSWPPREHRGSFFSVFVRLTRQTVPYTSAGEIRCEAGIRRWAGKRDRPLQLPHTGDRTSVYLAADVPWLPSLQHSTSFQVASLIRAKDRTNGGDYREVWGDYLADAMSELKPARSLPSPEELLLKPTSRIMASDGQVTAAVVYRAGMTPDHPVGTGLSPSDHRRLFDGISGALGSILEPVQEYGRVQLVVP